MSLNERIKDVTAAKNYVKPDINSAKKHICSFRRYITEKKALGKKEVPEELRLKIHSMLVDSSRRTSIDYQSTMSRNDLTNFMPASEARSKS